MRGYCTVLGNHLSAGFFIVPRGSLQVGILLTASEL